MLPPSDPYSHRCSRKEYLINKNLDDLDLEEEAR